MSDDDMGSILEEYFASPNVHAMNYRIMTDNYFLTDNLVECYCYYSHIPCI